MGALGWILSIVGVLGVGGFAAALIFAPPIAAAAVKIALDLLGRILSTRVGVGIAACIFGLALGYFYGVTSEREVWKQREVDHAAAMERIRTEAKADANARVSAAEATERDKTTAAEKRIAEYEKQLAATPIGACALDDADLAAGGIVRPRSNRLNIRRNPR